MVIRALIMAPVLTLLALACMVGDVGTFDAPPPPPRNFYAATTGNDANPGTVGSPWRTVQHAADFLRVNVLPTASSDVVVNLAAGDYGTLALTALDSGPTGFTVQYHCNAAIGTCRLLGGKSVTGWSTYSGSISRAAVTSCPQIIWENDVPARKARFPAYVSDGTHPQAFAPYLLTEGVAASSTVLQYVSGDLSPGAWSLTDAQVFIWSGGSGRAWFTDTIPIASLNLGARQFTLTQNTRYTIESGSRYFVQGVLSFLVGAGQFYCDSAALQLYYWPNNAPIGSQTITMPTVQDVVTMIGADGTHRVSRVTLDGLAIQYSDFGPFFRQAYPNDGDSGEGHTYPGYDRLYTLPSARHGGVRMENVDHVTVQRCQIKDHGYDGVYMRQYGQRVLFVNDEFQQIGHTGIYADNNYPGEGDVLNTNTFRNLRIHDFGQLVGSGAGIALTNSGTNYERNLRVYNGPRYGLTWYGYCDGTIPTTSLYVRNNLTEYFWVTNVGQDSGDVGGVYSFCLNDVGGPVPVNTWNQGIIDSVLAHASMTDQAPNGLFFDGGSSGSVGTNIKITNTSGAGFRSAGGVTFTLTNVTSTAVVDTANIGTDVGFPFP